MKVIISNELTIKEASKDLINWCEQNLSMTNPLWEKRFRMKLYVGSMPQKLYFYKKDGDDIILPYGLLSTIIPLLPEDVKFESVFPEKREYDYGDRIPLYDYQQAAVDELFRMKCGVLESMAGSGKTRMGLALIGRLGVKTLWLTHTHDLLNQSMKAALEFYKQEDFGTITQGKVNIGKSITFATVQTLAKQDLTQYRNTFDCVVVDEVHRVAGSPTSMNQFASVINAMAARYKYGLSATVHRADGLARSIFYYTGMQFYKVPTEAIENKVMKVHVKPVSTSTLLPDECFGTDGMMCYPKAITFLAEDVTRLNIIKKKLLDNKGHYNLLLSDRKSMLYKLKEMMPDPNDVGILVGESGRNTIRERTETINKAQHGDIHYVFATYALAKEGLNIPRLDRLHLATPCKDYAVVVQSVGRIARAFDGKDTPICYDYVDSDKYFVMAYKTRCRHYRKGGCDVETN